MDVERRDFHVDGRYKGSPHQRAGYEGEHQCALAAERPVTGTVVSNPFSADRSRRRKPRQKTTMQKTDIFIVKHPTCSIRDRSPHATLNLKWPGA